MERLKAFSVRGFDTQYNGPVMAISWPKVHNTLHSATLVSEHFCLEDLLFPKYSQKAFARLFGGWAVTRNLH
jgi:hypothetical protein